MQPDKRALARATKLSRSRFLATTNVIQYVFFYLIFKNAFEMQREREKITKTDLLPKWPQYLELSQTKARSLERYPGVACE